MEKAAAGRGESRRVVLPATCKKKGSIVLASERIRCRRCYSCFGWWCICRRAQGLIDSIWALCISSILLRYGITRGLTADITLRSAIYPRQKPRSVDMQLQVLCALEGSFLVHMLG